MSVQRPPEHKLVPGESQPHVYVGSGAGQLAGAERCCHLAALPQARPLSWTASAMPAPRPSRFSSSRTPTQVGAPAAGSRPLPHNNPPAGKTRPSTKVFMPASPSPAEPSPVYRRRSLHRAHGALGPRADLLQRGHRSAGGAPAGG